MRSGQSGGDDWEFDDGRGFPPYVPVAERRRRAAKARAKLERDGRSLDPVAIAGRRIAATFWGAGWCDHMESFSDYDNRLPRGRTYVRNGSVIDLAVTAGAVTALVQGSELYEVAITIETLRSPRWRKLVKSCSGGIDSLVDLLMGRLSEQVMRVVSDRAEGLFPLPGEMRFSCSCPDWADMCKHVAAVMYGVGNRLDREPELLFRLRGVDHTQLIANAAGAAAQRANAGATAAGEIDEADLAGVFGIELEPPAAAQGKPSGKTGKKAARKGAKRGGTRAKKAR